MNTPAHASDPQINQLIDGAEPTPATCPHGRELEWNDCRDCMAAATAGKLIGELDSARRASSTVTPDQLARLADQLTVIMGPDLQAFYDWNHELVLARSPVRFVGHDECNCPLARYLSTQVLRAIDVGDDEASIDGFVIVGLRGPWLAFVKAFDAAFETLEYVNVREVEALLVKNATALEIRA